MSAVIYPPTNLAHFDAPPAALGILRTDHPHYYQGAVEGESEADFAAFSTWRCASPAPRSEFSAPGEHQPVGELQRSIEQAAERR